MMLIQQVCRKFVEEKWGEKLNDRGESNKIEVMKFNEWLGLVHFYIYIH